MLVYGAGGLRRRREKRQRGVPGDSRRGRGDQDARKR